MLPAAPLCAQQGDTMKKDLQKNQTQMRQTLKLNRETLRSLESGELRSVGGGYTNSVCLGTRWCCLEN